MTSALIKQISFSRDSKLVTVTSAHNGTTHVYGINPQGGVVDAISHLDKKRSHVAYQNQAHDTCVFCVFAVNTEEMRLSNLRSYS